MFEDLIQKLEAAERPDRELDADVAEALGNPVLRPDDKGHLNLMWPSGADTYTITLPEFTASLDAAVSLVPEGWNWQLYGRDVLSQAGRSYCILSLPGTREADGRGATPTLAICIAALKARQAGESMEPMGEEEIPEAFRDD